MEKNYSSGCGGCCEDGMEVEEFYIVDSVILKDVLNPISIKISITNLRKINSKRKEDNRASRATKHLQLRLGSRILKPE